MTPKRALTRTVRRPVEWGGVVTGLRTGGLVVGYAFQGSPVTSSAAREGQSGKQRGLIPASGAPVPNAPRGAYALTPQFAVTGHTSSNPVTLEAPDRALSGPSCFPQNSPQEVV